MEPSTPWFGFVAVNLPHFDCIPDASDMLDIESEMDTGQELGKRPITFQDDHGQMMAYASQDIVEQMLDPFFPKRRRVNSLASCSPIQMKLMDLEDDLLEIILLELIGGERPNIVRQRTLKNLHGADSFVNSSSRMRQIFFSHLCDKVHTFDALYPLEKEDDGAKQFLPFHGRPDTTSLLPFMVGRNLRILRLSGFLRAGQRNVSYQRTHLQRAMDLMSLIAHSCTGLTEITFQDAGSIDNGISKLLFSNNSGLKKIQVDIPSAEFMIALAESECDIEELSLFRVQTPSLPGLKKVLFERGVSLRKLEIEMCFPLGPEFEGTSANKARCRRREKSFTEALEGLTRTKMTSLRTLHLHPDRRAGWFKSFIRHFQLLGQANLIVGSDWLEAFYPAAKTLEPPKPMFQYMSMDLLSNCRSQQAFDTYMERLHEPNTLSIMKGGFSCAYISERHENLEHFVKTAICRKGQKVKRLQLISPCQRLQLFEMFLETVAEILNFIEEKFESLDQIQDLRIPVHLVTYLGQGIGYELFLARLSNLKVLHFVKSSWDTEVSPLVPIGIPTFLRGIMNACPNLESIYICNKDYTRRGQDVKSEIWKRAIEDAVIALDEYEEANPKVDVWALRRQLTMWS